MADNIRNFNDYKNKNISGKIPEETEIKPGDLTEEIRSIEIQDPLDFLSDNERAEYYRTQHESMDRERESISRESEDFYFDEDAEAEKQPSYREERPVRREKKAAAKEEKPVRKEKAPARKKEEPVRKRSAKKARPEVTEEDWFDEDGEEGVNPYVIVRIASVITGIFILIILGMLFKVKIYDNYLKPDPDEITGEVSTGQIAGYTLTNDKVTTTADLNLRNTPSTASDDFIVLKVPTGTVLDRIAVSEDGTWAQIEYDNKVLYCVMKYLSVEE